MQSESERPESEAERFRRLLIDYVELDETDPRRPAWAEVDAAQQSFLATLHAPDLRAQPPTGLRAPGTTR